MRMPIGGMMRNRQGRAMAQQFDTGKAFTSQRDINPGNRTKLQQYADMVDPAVDNMRSSLLKLLGADPSEIGNIYNPASPMGGNALTRMAAGPEAIALMRALPAAGVVAGAGALPDVVFGEESMANSGMDLLGMGAGMYGMHRGKVGGTTAAGRALAMTMGAGIGKMASDAAQGIIGG